MKTKWPQFAAIGAIVVLSGCATQTRAPRGETMPTEMLPKGIASALFPDPAWR